MSYSIETRPIPTLEQHKQKRSLWTPSSISKSDSTTNQPIPTIEQQNWSCEETLRSIHHVQNEFRQRYQRLTGNFQQTFDDVYDNQYWQRLQLLKQAGYDDETISELFKDPALVERKGISTSFGAMVEPDGSYSLLRYPKHLRLTQREKEDSDAAFNNVHQERWQIYLSTLSKDPMYERRLTERMPGPSQGTRRTLMELMRKPKYKLLSGRLGSTWSDRSLKNPYDLRYPKSCSGLWKAYQAFTNDHEKVAMDPSMISLHQDYLVDVANQCSVPVQSVNDYPVPSQGLTDYGTRFILWEDVLENFVTSTPKLAYEWPYESLKTKVKAEGEICTESIIANLR